MNKTGQFIASVEHIALITPGFADGEKDTACIPALQHFVKALHKEGIRLTIFALHYPYRKEEYLWNGIRVIPLNGGNNSLKRLFFLKNRLRKAFAKQNERQVFTRIHACWLNEATVWSVALGKKYGLPVTATAMGQDVLGTNAYLKHAAIREVEKVVTLSTFHQHTFFHQTGLSSELIPWGLLPEVYPESEKTIDLIGVGNLIPLKNYDYFLRVCAHLKTMKPEVRAVIVGSGTEKNRLLQSIRKMGLEEQVLLVGQITYDETQELIRKSRILLHPSHFESFGMVIIEALAAGTTVFAGNTGIASDEESVEKLTGDSSVDAGKIYQILQQNQQLPKYYSVETTVEMYLEKIWH